MIIISIGYSTYKRNFDIKIYDNIMIETLKEKKKHPKLLVYQQ